MLSAFPHLFNYSLLAIAGLRIFWGAWFVWYAYNTLFGVEKEDTSIVPPWLRKAVAGASVLLGVLSIIGLFTQIAILVGLFIILLKWYFDVKSGLLTKTSFLLGFYIAIIGFSLLFIGPGALAVDLPL